jgi:hypothetical protein
LRVIDTTRGQSLWLPAYKEIIMHIPMIGVVQNNGWQHVILSNNPHSMQSQFVYVSTPIVKNADIEVVEIAKKAEPCGLHGTTSTYTYEIQVLSRTIGFVQLEVGRPDDSAGEYEMVRQWGLTIPSDQSWWFQENQDNSELAAEMNALLDTFTIVATVVD